MGAPKIMKTQDIDRHDLALAASLAATSRHPLAKALMEYAGVVSPAKNVQESPGRGLVMQTDDGEVRLGSRLWRGVPQTIAPSDEAVAVSELWLLKPNGEQVPFYFQDRIRKDADAVVEWAKSQGYGVILLSGDRSEAVRSAAETIGIDDWYAGQSPEDKIRFVRDLQAQGHKVAMVGDGLNDAPALAAADVSLSPSTATDISQNAADIVYFGGKLSTVLEIISAARVANRRVRENFSLALVYNVIALPLAVAGLVTPLIAAVAMSGSSLVVTANALRGFSRKEI